MTSKVKRELTYLTQFRILTQSMEHLGTRSMEIVVIRMLSDNVKYEILKPAVMDPISDTEKMIPSGTYAGRELLSIVEEIVELNQFAVDDQVIKMNKLNGITVMIINLDELNNSNNLENGHPSNTLFMYHVTDDKDFTHFEPQTPQYMKLKNGEFTSLTLRITDQNNNIIIDGPKVTVVLHINYNPLKNGIQKTIKLRMLSQNT